MLNCWPSGLLKKKMYLFLKWHFPRYACVFSKFIRGIYGKWTYENYLQFKKKEKKKEVWQLNILALLAFLSDVCVLNLCQILKMYIYSLRPVGEENCIISVIRIFFREYISLFPPFGPLSSYLVVKPLYNSYFHRSIKLNWYLMLMIWLLFTNLNASSNMWILLHQRKLMPSNITQITV